MTDRFTNDPAVVAPGGKVKICYTFPTGGPSSVTATLDYSPSSVPNGSATFTRENPCVEVTIPDTATSLIVIDDSGQSEDHEVPIS